MAKGNSKARVQEVAVKVKKTSAVRVRSIHDAKPFVSRPDTPPLNELTEKQLVVEGYRYPLIKRPNFSKTKEEKEELAKVKFKAERTPSTPISRDFSVPALYTIQVKYTGEGKKHIKTTYSAVLKAGEIFGYEKSLRIPEDVTIIKKVYGGKILWQKEKQQPKTQ